MCEYTESTQTYTGCEEKPVKHHIRIQIYTLCDEGKEIRQHCSNSTKATHALLGSSRAAGQCPNCTGGTAVIIVSIALYVVTPGY